MDMLNGDLQMQNDCTAAQKRSKKKGGNDDDASAAFHFIAFTPVEGTLWKLDGLERQPHNLGMVPTKHVSCKCGS